MYTLNTSRCASWCAPCIALIKGALELANGMRKALREELCWSVCSQWLFSVGLVFHVAGEIIDIPFAEYYQALLNA